MAAHSETDLSEALRAVEVLESYGLKAGRDIQLAADILESWRLLLNGKVDYVIDDAMAIPGALYGVLMYAGGLLFALAMRRLLPPVAAPAH